MPSSALNKAAIFRQTSGRPWAAYWAGHWSLESTSA